MENYREIDPAGWPRAVHCEVFRGAAQPQYCVSFELDVTHFLKEIKKSGYSFTFAMVYLVATCANEIEEFRYRFLDGKIVLFDRIHTSFTYLKKETGLFKVVNVPLRGTMQEYIALAAQTEKAQKEYFTGPMGVDIFQFSAMPWVSFTHISHTDAGRKENAAPLFDWGKYFKRGRKMLLPFAVQVHHSFLNGVHIGLLAEKLQQALNRFHAEDSSF